MTEDQKQRLEKFKKENPPRVPAYAHREEIIDLKYTGYSIKDIKEYLVKEYSIKTSDRTISRILNDGSNNKVAHKEPKAENSAKDFFTKK